MHSLGSDDSLTTQSEKNHKLILKLGNRKNADISLTHEFHSLIHIHLMVCLNFFLQYCWTKVTDLESKGLEWGRDLNLSKFFSVVEFFVTLINAHKKYACRWTCTQT